MQNETRQCQNCKQNFVIEPDDFSFYEKIKVPPPTFCPECRMLRRLVWRNERSLYNRKCNLCNKKIIAMYPNDSIFPVYCNECWYSDKWTFSDYGQDYDFSKSFFEQWKNLSQKVPRMPLFKRNLLNSDYANMCAESKNIYLSYSVILGSENVYYSRYIDTSFNIFDCYNIKNSNICFEDIDGQNNYNTKYTLNCKNCLDSCFLIDCVNCSNCFMSYNLRNKQYYIKNESYSKERYEEILKSINFGDRNIIENLKNDFKDIKNKAIYKYANIIKSNDSVGDHIFNSNNCKNCFDIVACENAKYCSRVLYEKDIMDIDVSGRGELMYEYCTGSMNDYNVKFSYSAFSEVRNADYVETCLSSNDLFGCISVKNGQYIILNKRYTQESYFEMVEKIKKHMNDMPYIDNNGRVYRYGEFFPFNLSAFCYNETVAQEYFPITKEQAIEKGYKWKEKVNKEYLININFNKIPLKIEDVNKDICDENIECFHKENCNHNCSKAFRITEKELSFYKKCNIPLPNKCPNCRYFERIEDLNYRLWHRQCMKEGCQNEFETSYAPDRPEIVYCERCYQQEVY